MTRRDDKPAAPITSTIAPPSAAPAADKTDSNTFSAQRYEKLMQTLAQSQQRATTLRSSISSSSAARNPPPQRSVTDDVAESMRNLDRSRLVPGLSRAANYAALSNTSLRYGQQRQKTVEVQQQERDLRRRLGRMWRVGDVYAPKDLGPREQQKWLKRQTVHHEGDVFEMIGKSPTAFYRNFQVLSEFVTETGRIKHSSQTGLKRKNQRKMAKTIRRAIALSIIPSIHKHPMMLKRGDRRD